MKKFLAVALMATAMVWAADPFTDGDDLVNGTIEWTAATEAESVPVDNLDPVEASFTVGATDETSDPKVWAWGELKPNPTFDFSNLGSIAVKGSFNQPVRLTLVGTGDATAGPFVVEMNEEEDRTIDIEDFAPAYQPEADIELDLADMTGLSFASIAEETTYEITIESLILNASDGNGNGNGNGGDDEDGNGEDGVIELIIDDEDAMLDIWKVDGYKVLNIGEENVEAVKLTEDDGLNIKSYYPVLEADLPLYLSDEEYIGDGDEDEPDGVWSWVSLSAWIAESLEGLESIEIEYEASEDMVAVIANGSGANLKEFGADLDKTTEKTKITLTPASFKLPSWAGSGTLDLSATDGNISFAPNFDAGGAEDGEMFTIKIYSVKVTGVTVGDGGGDDDGDDDDNPITKVKTANFTNLAITGVSAGKLGLSVPTAGNYSIALYSVDGRMLAQTKTNLVRGVNTLAIGKNLAKGIAVVRIKGANAQLVKKIMLK